MVQVKISTLSRLGNVLCRGLALSLVAERFLS